MIRTAIKKLIRHFLPIAITGIGNTYTSGSKLHDKFFVSISGKNNSISIGKDCYLSNTEIFVTGDNNQIVIEDKVRFYGPCQIKLQGNATLIIRENAGIRGVEFTVIDGKVEIGKLCMFSYNIVVRNTDSHKVIDAETGVITNPSRDVVLGEHVWVCQNSSILKGCKIGDNSIVAFGAVATKGCEAGSILAGNPAKVVKTGITWDY